MLNKLSPTIAVIDSGIGGLSVLCKLINKYQYGNYIYYADNLNMPYGTKSREFVKNRVLHIINELKDKYQVDIIIIACNTASSILRNTKIDRVVKLCFDNKSSVYLTTPLTAKSIKNISAIPDGKLAEDIENNIFERKKLDKIVKKEVKSKKLNKLNNLILGCTHYELVKEIFEKYCPKTHIETNSEYMLKQIDYKPITSEFSLYFLTSRNDKKYIDKMKAIVTRHTTFSCR